MRSKLESLGKDGLGAAARRIARWRKTCRGGRARMPEELWREAVKLALVHGITPTVRALRLDYGRLKKRVVAAGGLQTAVPGVELARPAPVPAFIDVGSAGEICQRVQRETRTVAGVMAIELTLATGERLTIRFDRGQSRDQTGRIGESRGSV